MDNNLYESIVKNIQPEVLATLEAYADYKITQHQITLEKVDTVEEVKKLQGAIAELRFLKKIRKTALNVLEQGR